MWMERKYVGLECVRESNRCLIRLIEFLSRCDELRVLHTRFMVIACAE